ncbi:MAG: hypothetical protein M3246_09515 [Actinomycetota bacterium]|nr:hypothetical protein [Actinomycetota bacterium]
MNRKSFFSKVFGRGADEDETRIYSAEEIETKEPEKLEEEQPPQGFTVERAAEIIDYLPPEVPRESAVRIVRGTLAAAGIKTEDLERSTRAREAKLNSEIELARSRQKDLRERTEEVVRSLQEEIRKAREARDTGIAEEEQKVSRAVAGLKDVRRVRAFFGFPGTGGEETTDPAGDETQSLEPFDPDKTQVMQRPGSLAGTDGPAGGSTEGPTPAATDER